jgi:lon-related putative ATP-dependent protease
MPTELTPDQLYRRVDPAQLPFATTADAEAFTSIIGQARALDAVLFGTRIRREGYNLFVMGPPGVGKATVVRRVLEQQAAAEATPDDYCYVHNFDEPHKPRALRLPSGRGRKLRDTMQQLVEELHHSIPAAFESDQYRSQVQQIEQDLKQREENDFLQLQRDAEKKHVNLFRTPTGYAFAPTRNGNVIGPDEFRELPEAEQQRIEKDVTELQERLEEFIRSLSRLRRERRARVKKLNREVTMFAVGQLLAEVKKDYADLPKVLAHLDTVEQDIIDNADSFRRQEEPPSPLPGMLDHGSVLRRYDVNVLVDHGGTHGAPIVDENLPTHQNLVGRVEHVAQLGALVTDFTLIKPGALHLANGGYLILDARKVLTQPYAWEGLKRVLQSRSIRIESLGQLLGLMSTVSLEPEPIELDVKVALIGERILYYLLAELDPEFGELFKVAADFEDTVEWTPENHAVYARLLCTLCQKENLRPFDRGAVARLIEYSTRIAGHSEKLSTHLGEIVDLMREADFWAQQTSRAEVCADDVKRAIAAKDHRLSRIHEVILDEIRDGTILIDTDGAKVAQVNGLSVVEIGGRMYGQPSRITATVRLGEGEIVNIEHEVEMSGAIHSKGVMILSSYLSSRYAAGSPLSLAATLAFEQSYSQVEGDSASMAELAALLSALADVPIKQCIAITGSINQHGQIQAIGAVNEKIEGFFDLCKIRGLTGDHGVLIPQSNVKHLMLREDVVDAVTAGRFHIHAVSTADEAIELLTGVRAGSRDKKGAFPKGSVNQLVEERLLNYATLRHEFGEKAKDK